MNKHIPKHVRNIPLPYLTLLYLTLPYLRYAYLPRFILPYLTYVGVDGFTALY